MPYNPNLQKLTNSITYRGKTYFTGDKIIFDRGDGTSQEDVIRYCFIQDICRAPYGRNTKAKAVTLTSHSWTFCSNIVKKIK